MITFRRAAGAALLAPLLLTTTQASAGVGDLLVAPTRIVLNGSRGTEIILNNIGDDVATYRISVELRRMKADGTLEEVTAPDARETTARDMILYAPRRVTLPPRQPQAIRIAARAPQGLADGEYRVHVLFRAVPPPRPAASAENKDFKGIGFALTPIYGVTIPVIVRFGNLQATAGISDVKLASNGGKKTISLDLQRSGERSTYGEIRVLKAGVAEPIAVQRGVAVYTELGARKVNIPLDEKAAAGASGKVTVQYVEVADGVSSTLAETQAVLR